MRSSLSWLDSLAPGWAGLYCQGGMDSSRTASIISSSSIASVERFSWARPSSTSCWTSQEIGATLDYQGQLVRLLWQSRHASLISCSVRGLSQAIVRPPVGLLWSRP